MIADNGSDSFVVEMGADASALFRTLQDVPKRFELAVTDVSKIANNVELISTARLAQQAQAAGRAFADGIAPHIQNIAGATIDTSGVRVAGADVAALGAQAKVTVDQLKQAVVALDQMGIKARVTGADGSAALRQLAVEAKDLAQANQLLGKFGLPARAVDTDTAKTNAANAAAAARDTAGDVLPAPGAFDAGAVTCKPVNRECLYGVSRLALATA